MFGAEANLLKRILRAGDVVYDIGANYGFTAVFSAQIVGDEGEVLAFEPSSIAFRLLALNAAAKANVKTFKLALGDHEGTATFYNAQSVDMSSLTAPSIGIPIRSSESVTVVPLDRFIADRALRLPNMIKCDVEGAEKGVFSGAGSVLSRNPMVLFEYADSLAKPYGYSLNCLLDLLLCQMKSQATVYRVADDGSTYTSLDVCEGISNNYLIVPERYSNRLDAR